MCEHERLRTVGDRVFCCQCGTELPLEFLLGEQKKAEEPKKAPARKRTKKEE